MAVSATSGLRHALEARAARLEVAEGGGRRLDRDPLHELREAVLKARAARAARSQMNLGNL